MSANTTSTQQLTPLTSALAGALGGVFSNAVVYPLDTVKTRIQATSTSASTGNGKKAETSVISLLLRILKEEGISGYYSGFGASMLNTFSTQYAYFFFYSFVRNSYIKRITSKIPAGSKIPPLSTAMELILGAVAGALAQIFTIPVSVIATRQQIGHVPFKPPTAPSEPSEVSTNKPSYAAVTDPSSSTAQVVEKTEQKAKKHDNSFLAVGRKIVREEGVTGLWLGLKPSLVLTVNPAITYGVFERVKSLMLLAKEKTGVNARLTPWQIFFVGALSKALATIVTYPYIMAKVRIQAGTQEDEAETLPTSSKPALKQKGAVSLLTEVLKQEGILGWYRGMGAQLTKAVLTQALLFSSKDQFERYALAIMIAYQKLASP